MSQHIIFNLFREEVPKIVSEVKRNKNESFEAFFRRTKREWKASGRILQARKVQFFDDKYDSRSKNVKKNQAVVKSQKQSKIQYLQKTGKLPQDDRKNRRRR